MMTAGRIHPIHGRPCGTPGRRMAAKSRGPDAGGRSFGDVGQSNLSGSLGGAPRRQVLLFHGQTMSRTRIGAGINPSLWKRSATRLLLGENVVIERPECELRSIDRSLLRRKINAARFGENGRDLIAVLVSPCRRRRDGAIDRGDHVRMLGGEVAIDKKE